MMGRPSPTIPLLLVTVLWGGWLHCPTNADHHGLCRRLKFSTKIDGYALQGHVIRNLSLFPVPSIRTACTSRCILDPVCVSVNIGPPTEDRFICEFSDSDHIRHPKDLKRREGFVYIGTENPCLSNPCHNDSTCLNGFTDKGYLCECQAGYTGEQCKNDIDECTTATHSCPANADCVNTNGSYNCTCKSGYSGDGLNCSDIDECAASVDPCDAVVNSTCKNTNGSYICQCKDGLVKNKNGSLCGVGAVITQKPPSLIVEEGYNLSLVCQATGQPKPTVTWQKAYSHLPRGKTTVVDGILTICNITKADGGAYVCVAKNLLGEDSAVAQVTVIELKFTLTPPVKVVASLYSKRSIEATSVLDVFNTPMSCSSIKSGRSGSSSGNYMIDPDGKGGVTPFSVYCDMSDKGGVGVTVISHDSESRTHVGNIPGCNVGNHGCYSKDVRYTGVSTVQLAALTRISQYCEQFIKFECNNDVAFIVEGDAWWMSRDGTQMNYWGGATGHDKMCACGVTNSCSNGKKCNCYNSGGGWREDSGLLTEKSALPVTQIRLGDLNSLNEEGYHTLGKLKCYGWA
ncbi:hypothetical protein ACROYT_G039845 [Oculina patagonica]